MRKWLPIVMMILLPASMPACKQEGEKADQPSAAGPAQASAGDSRFAGFDPADEIKAMEGSWKVKDSAFAKEPAEWKIEGQKVTIKRGDKVKQGEIEIEYPGQLAFVEKAGGGSSKTYYAYARDGQDLYIGLGKAGSTNGERYTVAVDDGVVVFDGAKCSYYKKKMFGGLESAPAEIQCSVKDEGGQKQFHYAVPDRFKKGEMQQAFVHVIGKALLNDQMKGHKVEKTQ
ncbi:MAG: hypothetical protein JXR96_01940 [Deltaproteobacteria bacterium]|nr:hypothetical protein [Deltaproteobacteria bacterium]